jgi:hypothetical protein
MKAKGRPSHFYLLLLIILFAGLLSISHLFPEAKEHRVPLITGLDHLFVAAVLITVGYYAAKSAIAVKSFRLAMISASFLIIGIGVLFAVASFFDFFGLSKNINTFSHTTCFLIGAITGLVGVILPERKTSISLSMLVVISAAVITLPNLMFLLLESSMPAFFANGAKTTLANVLAYATAVIYAMTAVLFYLSFLKNRLFQTFLLSTGFVVLSAAIFTGVTSYLHGPIPWWIHDAYVVLASLIFMYVLMATS